MIINNALAINQLSKKLGYTFQDSSLLIQALTHRSAKGDHNERLEFLGDSILGFVIAESLYDKFPQENEGDLSKRYSFIVSCDSLSEVAIEMGVDNVIKLSHGEKNSNGALKKSNLENCLEAIIGAVYFDQGIDECREFILRNFANRLSQFVGVEPPVDPVSRLQEITQEKAKTLPEVNIQRIDGNDHDPVFEAHLTVQGLGIDVKARGSSKKEANKNACIEALKVF